MQKRTGSPSATTRRRLLASLGAGMVAGCVDRPAGSGSPPTGRSPTHGDGPDASSDPSGTDRTVPTPEGRTVGDSFATGDRTVTVETAAVRRSVATRAGNPAHVDVAAPADVQFVACEVRYSGDLPLEVEDFGLVADGTAVDGRAVGWWPGSTPDDGVLRVAVEVPVGRHDRAAVVWRRPDGDPVRWALLRAQVRALGRVPAFDVRRFAVPDTVREGEPIPVTLAVANAGDRDGRFLAELGAVVLSDVGEIRFDVPAGGSVTHEESLTPSSYTPMYGDQSDPLRVVLDWGTGKLERELQVRRD